MMKMSPFSLLPAPLWIPALPAWVPAFAGMTAEGAGMTRWEPVQGGEGPLLKLRKAIASKTSLSSRNEGG